MKSLWDRPNVEDLKDNPEFLAYAKDFKVVGRRVTDWSRYLGSYGQGGVGFFGLQLHNGVWLVLSLPHATGWMELHTHNRNFIDATYQGEEMVPILKTIIEDHAPRPMIQSLEIDQHTTKLVTQDFTLEIHAETESRKPHNSGSLRAFRDDDDLRVGWFISASKYIDI